MGFGDVMADAIKGLFSKDHYDILEAGTYEYPFTYQLPPNLPADFESGESSRIAYELKGYVDIPLKIDISAKAKLTVYESYDASAICPVSADNSKSFAMDSGNVELKVELDRNMFLPGESVRGTIGVVNESGKHVDAIQVDLNRVIELKAEDIIASQTNVTSLTAMPSPGVPRGRPNEIPFEVTLPTDLYNSVETSELVKVRYDLQVRLDIPWAIDLETHVPITIIEEAGVPSGVSLQSEADTLNRSRLEGMLAQ